MKILNYSLVFFLLIVQGCKTSYIAASWKSSIDDLPKNYNRILVLGLLRDSDSGLCKSMEGHFVGDLHNLGYNTVSSIDEYGFNAFHQLDEKASALKLRNSGIDAVITIVLLDVKKDSSFIPGNINVSPVGPEYYKDFWNYRGGINKESPYGLYLNRFWDYQFNKQSRIYEPGYYVVNSQYFWETNFYELESQDLIYSVRTSSFNPRNAETMSHEYGNMIVKDMVRMDVLSKHPALATMP